MREDGGGEKGRGRERSRGGGSTGGREGQKFKVILRYIGSLTPAWAKGHPCLRKNETKLMSPAGSVHYHYYTVEGSSGAGSFAV